MVTHAEEAHINKQTKACYLVPDSAKIDQSLLVDRIAPGPLFCRLADILRHKVEGAEDGTDKGSELPPLMVVTATELRQLAIMKSAALLHEFDFTMIHDAPEVQMNLELNVNSTMFQTIQWEDFLEIARPTPATDSGKNQLTPVARAIKSNAPAGRGKPTNGDAESEEPPADDDGGESDA